MALTFLDLLFWSYQKCRRRFFESLLIVVAIGLGVGVIVSVLALFNGVRMQQKAYLEQPHYRTIRVTAMEDLSQIFANSTNPLVSIPDLLRLDGMEFSLTDLAQLKTSFPSLFVFVQQSSSFALTRSASETLETRDQRGLFLREELLPVVLTTPDYFSFFDRGVLQGEFFSALDVEQANRVVVLGHALSERLFPEGNALGKEIFFSGNAEPYHVLGVVAPVSSSQESGRFGGVSDPNMQAFLPFTAGPYREGSFGAQGRLDSTPLGNMLSGFLGQGTSFSEIRLGLPSSIPLSTTLRSVREYVDLTYGDTVTLYAPFEVLQEQQEQFLFMGMILALFASIGLVIAAVNILTLMLARILRRTRSIGISMALGASKRGVFFEFLVEAGMLGFAGAFLGIGLSYGGVRLISLLVEEPIAHSVFVQLGGVGIALVLSFLFGVYPAIQGAQIRPVDALRLE